MNNRSALDMVIYWAPGIVGSIFLLLLINNAAHRKEYGRRTLLGIEIVLSALFAVGCGFWLLLVLIGNSFNGTTTVSDRMYELMTVVAGVVCVCNATLSGMRLGVRKAAT